MIKTKFLRLGNLITDIEGRRILTVKKLAQNQIEVEEDGTVYTSDDVNGMPLSYYQMAGVGGFGDYVFPTFEEFRHLQNGQIILRFPNALTEEGSAHVFKLTKVENIETPVFLKTISYLHELQNIVFITVGKDLRLDKKDLQITDND